MSDQPQTISVAFARINPVQVKPVADVLIVVPDRSSKIQYTIGKFVEGKVAVPAVATVPGRGAILESGTKGSPGYQPYVPPVTPILGTPEVPAVQDSVLPVDSGTVEMTDDEWNSWPAGSNDTDYRFTIVAKRLNLTLT